jgi:hypothetical protein
MGTSGIFKGRRLIFGTLAQYLVTMVGDKLLPIPFLSNGPRVSLRLASNMRVHAAPKTPLQTYPARLDVQARTPALLEGRQFRYLEQVSVGLNRKDFQGFVNERV